MVDRMSDQEILRTEIGPSGVADIRGWLRTCANRTNETTADDRQFVSACRRENIALHGRSQTLTHVDAQDIPGLLAACLEE